MLIGYRESYNAHDAAILATQFYVEIKCEEEIEIFDVGEGLIEIVGSFEYPWLELQLAGSGDCIKNYKKADNLFSEDMVAINFLLGKDEVSYDSSRGVTERMEKVIEEYLLLLKKDIINKFQTFKDFLQKEDVNYHGEGAVCKAATIAYLAQNSEEPIALLFNYLTGMLQDKMCFDCIRMHNYYSNCLQE